MSYWVKLAVVLTILNGICIAKPIESIKCLGGGDGPNPLSDITSSDELGLTVFKTQGSVSEFVVWEKKGYLVYRNHEGRIYQLSLSNGKSFLMGSSTAPLSRVKDDHDRYLTLKGRPYTLDTGINPPRWQKWSHKNGVTHLYWHKFFGDDSLFSVDASFIRPNQQRIEVYSFSRKGVKPHLCNLFSNQGEIYHLGQGHVYPYVFLYKVKPEAGSTRLTYHNIQIEGELLGKPVCKLYKSGQYSTLLPGNVKAVYQFPELMTSNLNMFVVATDHPEKNLLWDDGVYGCRFYKTNGNPPMVLNTKQPMWAVWDEEEGLSLVYPRKLVNGEPAVLNPLKGLIEGPIKSEHLYLSDNGKVLYVLAKPRGSDPNNGRLLIRVELY